MFNKEIYVIENKINELELISKFKNIDKSKLEVKNQDNTSKFTSLVRFQQVSKFSPLPMDIKSDLDIPIPMHVELWWLKEGPNRDGIVPLNELIGATERASGNDIIPFHDMEDMSSITKYNITDECGTTDDSRIEKDEFGVNWAVTNARITNRNVAYQMYLKKLKGEPIEISVEYLWRPKQDLNGNIIQTFIRPGAISLVKSGHIKGNKIIIKSDIEGGNDNVKHY